MPVRLAHVCIECTDLESTEAFYTKLGARRQFEFRNLQDQLIGMYMHFGGNSFIEIVKVTTAKPEGKIVHFALEVEEVTSTRDALLAQGIEVTEPVLGVDHTWMITCTDPNGVFIELHQYTPQSLQQQGGSCVIDYTP